MTHICTHGSCWVMAVFGFMSWLLLSSALLWLSWNRVVGELAKVKQAKYWQALLLVSTICFFALPRWYMMRHHCHSEGACGRSHCESKHCPYEGHWAEGEKGDCPYSHGEKPKN